jgi:hypothetical protein
VQQVANYFVALASRLGLFQRMAKAGLSEQASKRLQKCKSIIRAVQEDLEDKVFSPCENAMANLGERE